MGKTLSIGLIVAMDIEATCIESYMQNIEKRRLGAKIFTIGNIGAVRVVMVNSGVGKVNAAYATTLLVHEFTPDYIICTGVAGGLQKLPKKTIIIAEKVVQYDMDTSAIGDPRGYISGVGKIFIEADKNMSKMFIENKQISDKFNLQFGTIATGDMFVSDSKKSNEISEIFGAVACDMESAAVGQVAYLEQVPFAIIRAISDDAGDDAAKDYSKFLIEVSKINAEMVNSAICRF